ncbi:MAG TPA: cytochrome c maturation protein CcmE [Candidatus Saccharimonadales bacterium]|nr:cytochrome c maturation protein CcmE [Candidatus Saccharimonadales bacterium]
MTRRRPRAITVIGLALVVIAFGALIVTALTSALEYDVTPTELALHQAGGTIRLYGIVVPKSERWDAVTKTLSFALTDGSTTVEVRSTALPTDLFRDGAAVVVAGQADGTERFTATEVLVKHSEVYAPLAPGQTIPPGVVQQLEAGGGSP